MRREQREELSPSSAERLDAYYRHQVEISDRYALWTLDYDGALERNGFRFDEPVDDLDGLLEFVARLPPGLAARLDDVEECLANFDRVGRSSRPRYARRDASSETEERS